MMDLPISIQNLESPIKYRQRTPETTLCLLIHWILASPPRLNGVYQNDLRFYTILFYLKNYFPLKVISLKLTLHWCVNIKKANHCQMMRLSCLPTTRPAKAVEQNGMWRVRMS